MLLFISCLTIFILRVAQSHVGRRTTASPFDTFLRYMFSRSTIQTFTWYMVSAFLYCEVYIFATSKRANLAWVDPGRSYERPRLNERPVIFRSLFLLVALSQAALHIYQDQDRLLLPEKRENQSTTDEQSKTATQPAPILQRVQKVAVPILQRALTLTILVTFLGPFVYFLFMRRSAWSIAHSIGKMFFTLHKSSKPSGLTGVVPLAGRFFISSTLLVMLWEASNQAFTTFASEEPLKKGQPLTTDSKDPNGSLIAGLKAKKELPRAMAFWELSLITERFEERRKTIYQDSDRPNGSTWFHISGQCLAEINNINDAIRRTLQPPAPQAVQQEQQPQPKQRIVQPLREKNVFNAPPRPSSARDAITNGVGSVAKSIGSSPGQNPMSRNAQKMIDYGANKILTPEQQQNLNKTGLAQRINQYVMRFLRSPLGVLFRRPFRRRVNAIVFGTPYSQASNLHHAIRSLSKLVVSSLREDNIGEVQKDVRQIIQVFTTTIQNIQALVQALPPHWTDVDFNKREVPEVDELVAELRNGLEQIVISFGEYADALGLSRTELRAAKEAVNRKPEMEVAKN